ncbi:cytochrome c biogenesis protein CcmA [Tritonibacter multivorans]|uniref:Cytochrome c biogenesis protein CcmA n=1 Tax=Tritonibacter multivorans TaxID=928856 RepID=A0A0P1G9A7_9RHOB|nr:AAA family ATPase [Tritonibacter multivorans]MDA7421693.1 AAA family ATPase [Tritonibacter multivorans]CUH78091.1 cytochrome c biogenesis protein CcmA [Tritonibacter multivorans]SFD02728.1 AAA domain-containing protein [Tritonibacter multivorans]
MAFEELITWSDQKVRPDWQKDALRRLATTGELSKEDLSDLRKVVEKATELIDDEVAAVTPLAAEYLSDPAADAPRTILGAIGPVRRVDRLAGDQPPIKFAKNGITLVYGANASGKSGYCRIAKQLCRSLSPQDLKGNVYEAASADPPEVDLVFGMEGDEPDRQEATWRHGDPSPAELARISVFDTATARVYVDKDRKVEFLPYELDLLNKLALAAKALDGDFEVRENGIDAAIRTPLPAGYTDGTAVSQALAKLVPETELADLPDEAGLRALSVWNDEKEADLQSVSDEIRDDPKERLRSHRLAKQGLENIKTALSGHLGLLADDGVAKIKDAHTDMTTKAEAAKTAAQGLGEGMPIPEIGSESWRKMLIYARDFAGEAFPVRDDPKLATGESCVLCQQPLEDDAASRMARFDEYISGRTASDSQKATEDYEVLVASINALRLGTQDQTKALLGVYGGLSDDHQAFVDEITLGYHVLASRLEAVKAMIAAGTFDGADALEAVQVDLIQKIDAALENLQAQIDVLENADADEERMKTLASEKAELEDAKKLSQEIEIVVARFKQLVERLKIKEARKLCASGPIARQLTARRRVILTKSLKTQLTEELETLKLSHIPIDLSDRSAGPDSVIEVGLTAHQRVANNSDVLSEGEQRALALSCFLAELIEVGAEHGIIVDDPVSSLDHSRMEAVAKRLVAEASAGRQVIIFTHNIVFHYMMENEARRADIPCHTEWMSSLGGTKFGIIDDSGKPNHTKKAKQRIGELNEAKAKLYKDGYDPAVQEFRDPLTAIYTLMRETWERIVEEILFNGTIQRFRPEVMTQSLKHACYDPADDYPAIFEGMKRCSHHSGHDRAADLPQELPEKVDIDADLQALVEFHKKVSDRKAVLEKGHSYEKGPEPEFL